MEKNSTNSLAQVDGADYDNLIEVTQNEAISHVLASLSSTGLQATQIGKARDLVQEILYQRREGHKIFLSYTSNLISSGLREVLSYLAREKLVDCFVSTAGGIEEDVIKCLGSTLLGKFNLDGVELRKRGINRIGNLLVPNDCYCDFQDFFMPVLESIHNQQRSSRWETMTTPSEIIQSVGQALADKKDGNSEKSLTYWCSKNSIPFFSPALTDGSMGDMIYFYNFSKKGLVVDPVKDVEKLRDLGLKSGNRRICCIILGGGLPKHHLLRNVKADRVLMITTGTEVDGCPSSGILRDDYSSGLLNADCECVRVQGDATFIFPLLLCHK